MAQCQNNATQNLILKSDFHARIQQSSVYFIWLDLSNWLRFENEFKAIDSLIHNFIFDFFHDTGHIEQKLKSAVNISCDEGKDIISESRVKSIAEIFCWPSVCRTVSAGFMTFAKTLKFENKADKTFRRVIGQVIGQQRVKFITSSDNGSFRGHRMRFAS